MILNPVTGKFEQTTPKATFSRPGKVLQTVYNVMDNGAKGDGVADDYASIAITAAAANAAGGGIVQLAKVHKVNSTLPFYNNVYYRGLKNSTQIIQGDNTKDVFYGTGLSNFGIEDIFILGTGDGTHHGINIANSSYFTFNRVRVEQMGGDGIHLVTATQGIIDRSVSSHNVGIGIFLYSGSNENMITFNKVVGNVGEGYFLNGNPTPNIRNLISGNLFDNNGGSNYSNTAVYRSSDNILSNNTYKNGTSGTNLEISTNSDRCIVIGNVSYGSAQQGVALIGVKNCIIKGNTIFNNHFNGITLSTSDEGDTHIPCNNNIIEGNEILNNSQAGSGVSDGIWVTNNGAGVGSNYNIIKGNTISGTNQNYGIEVQADCSLNIIEGNDLEGNKTLGLLDNGINTVISVIDDINGRFGWGNPVTESPFTFRKDFDGYNGFGIIQRGLGGHGSLFGLVQDGVYSWGIGMKAGETTLKFLSNANSGGLGTGVLSLQSDGVILPVQAPTTSAPAYVKGGIYFDTTLNKLRIGGASGWETVTSE